MPPTMPAPPPGAADPRGPVGVHPPSRALRSAVAAGTATAFGLAGHLVAGGTTSFPVLASALAVAVLPAWLLSARERSWIAIAGLQVGTQLLVHEVLSVAGPPVAGGGLMPHDLMFHVHALAGLIAAAAMRLGERRLWAAARRLAARVARWWRRHITCGAGPVRHSAQVPAVTTAAVAGARALRHVRVLRGPPATT
ncbi:MAG: hypothetical protein L0H84_06270 [Pseudonocardia sp.]|nr:hypothetical protein [Pseudonocardia sp.]